MVGLFVRIIHIGQDNWTCRRRTIQSGQTRATQVAELLYEIWVATAKAASIVSTNTTTVATNHATPIVVLTVEEGGRAALSCPFS